MKAKIGVLSGDACGIGPELVAKLLNQSDILEDTQVLLIGDERVVQMGAQIVQSSFHYSKVSSASEINFKNHDVILLDRQNIDPKHMSIGTVSAHVGQMMLEDLTIAMDLVSDGMLDALCFAPLNKQALHLGGDPFEDELHFFADHLGTKDFFCEVNVMDEIWTTRATSHLALRDIFELLTPHRVFQAIQMAHHSMSEAGYERPEIFVSALNPHGGEGGLFGDEEELVIGPAIEKAQKIGIQAKGPFPADTIFLNTKDRKGIGVSMYHDQGQVALKLMGCNRGVTIQGGLPIPITTPAHGTAFDIAGQGVAKDHAIRLAFDLAVKMGKKRKFRNDAELTTKIN